MPVDPAEIVHDVMVMNPALQSPSAEIAIVRPLPLVLAHPTLLSQCFSNLLSNAIKFVKPGVIPRVVIRAEKSCGHSLAGRIQVYADYSGLPLGSEVSPASVRPDRIRLWVQDNGIGMEPEVQQKAFGIFERGRGLSGIPGTGVGLAIVAKAMQRMNGDCGVESAPDEGSRFWLELAAA
jgi:signal transduction histidine kinase